MRDKESVTQIFILYGYEKAPDAYSTGGFLFFPRQASNVMPAWGYDRESGASLPKFPY